MGKGIAIIWLAILLPAAAEDAETKALSAKIVGKWKHEHRQIGVQANTIKTYNADGSYFASSTVRLVGKTSGVNYEGRWEILPDRTLRLKVTKTNNRLFVPMGEVYLMKNLQIKDGVMTYARKGKPNREIRQTN